MVSTIAPPTTTAVEYLKQEVLSPTRNEYRNGEIIPMTGGTPTHNRVSGNLYISLSLSLRQKPYEVFHLDQRLWVPGANVYTYPDVMALAKPIQLQAGRTDTVMNPCFVAEVLSKSTQDYDRGEKFLAYRSIETCREYLLIDQYSIHVEHYLKTAAHQWLFSEYSDPAITLSLESLNCTVKIADLYENVDFTSTSEVAE
jgi:Uma2 family endonuclease